MAFTHSDFTTKCGQFPHFAVKQWQTLLTRRASIYGIEYFGIDIDPTLFQRSTTIAVTFTA